MGGLRWLIEASRDRAVNSVWVGTTTPPFPLLSGVLHSLNDQKVVKWQRSLVGFRVGTVNSC